MSLKDNTQEALALITKLSQLSGKLVKATNSDLPSPWRELVTHTKDLREFFEDFAFFNAVNDQPFDYQRFIDKVPNAWVLRRKRRELFWRIAEHVSSLTDGLKLESDCPTHARIDEPTCLVWTKDHYSAQKSKWLQGQLSCSSSKTSFIWEGDVPGVGVIRVMVKEIDYNDRGHY